MTIHFTTTEPLTEAEQAALEGFVRSLRPPKPEHLPGCVPDTHEEDLVPKDKGLGILEQDSYTTLGRCADGCPVWEAQEKERTRHTTGKWTCSTNEEHFNCSEQFDTEADAIEYGKILCEENGLEDGDPYYTGQIDAVTADEMALGAPSSDRVVENIEEYLCDNLGGEIADQGLAVNQTQLADLDDRLRACVKGWILAHDLVPNWCHIERSKSHIFHQCAEVDSMKFDPNNHPRCILALGHEGEHDFP